MNAATIPPLRPAAHTASTSRDDHDVRLAWACLIASPAAFLLAFVVGEGTSILLGYDGVGFAPWWIATTTLLLAAAVFCLPALLATWFRHRAGRAVTTGRRCRPSSSTCCRPRSSASTCWPTSSACSSRTSEPTDEVPRPADLRGRGISANPTDGGTGQAGGSTSVWAGRFATPTGQVSPLGPWLQYPLGFLCRYCWW